MFLKQALAHCCFLSYNAHRLRDLRHSPVRGLQTQGEGKMIGKIAVIIAALALFSGSAYTQTLDKERTPEQLDAIDDMEAIGHFQPDMTIAGLRAVSNQMRCFLKLKKKDCGPPPAHPLHKSVAEKVLLLMPHAWEALEKDKEIYVAWYETQQVAAEEKYEAVFCEKPQAND
jgi:hypothetical protein